MRSDPFLVADLFCGAGGFSTGAVKAIRNLGREVVLTCVNHWPLAIETHSRNHPEARHYIEDLQKANPVELVPEGRLDLLMASPECTYHSNARGGRPIHDQKRMDPWAVINWLTRLDVRCVLIENVPEFRNWGPLNDANRPDPAKRGQYFEAWFNAIVGLGYEVQFRVLNAADFGDATTRTRFFLMARKDGRAITWPDPTHARGGPDGMFSNRERWRAAREIIDWENPGRSLLDDPKYKRTPLSEKTRKRIARGLERFGGPLAPLYISLLGIQSEAAPNPVGREEPFVLGKQASPAIRGADQPLMTVTTESGPHLVRPLAEPFVMGKQAREKPTVRGMTEPLMTVTTDSGPAFINPSAELVGGNRNNNVPHDAGEPLPGLTTAPGGGVYVVEAGLTPFTIGQQSAAAPRSAEEPIATVAGAGAISLVQPFLVPYYKTGVPYLVEEPLHTVTTRERNALTWALVVPYGPRAEARSGEEPLPTVLTKDRLAVASPFLVPKFGEREGQGPRVHDVADPLPTVTGDGAGRLVEPVLIQTDQTGSNGLCARPVDEPAPTVVTKQNLALTEPVLIQMAPRHGDIAGVRPVQEPIYTVVTNARQSVVNPVLIEVNHGDDAKSGDRAKPVDVPLGTVTTHRSVALAEPVLDAIQAGQLDPRRLVVIDDQLYQLDIRFRMLNNRELARAMSFDDDEFTYEFAGTSSEVTKQIGNAVPVRTARALVTEILR